MQNSLHQPRGELSLRTVAMPADTNPAGDIFGGWIMSLMDLAAGYRPARGAKGTGGDGGGVEPELPAAGEGRRRGVRLYRHHQDRPHLDHRRRWRPVCCAATRASGSG